MAGIFGIGVSGIQAAQVGMQVTQHNIANSNTIGYNRQSIVQATTTPTASSIGSVGNGVQVTTIQRQYNSFLSQQVNQSESELSSLDSYFKQIQVVDDLLADANAGVSPALQDFFKGVQQVATYPASLPARQAMVSSAQTLATRFQAADQRISDLYGQVNQQVSDSVSMINNYGEMIANLNQRIVLAESAVNQPANDLLDQRDQLVSELNKIIKVNVVPIGRGGIEVFIGKGQLLVMGNQTNKMTAVRSSEDPSRIGVALDQGGGPQELPDSLLTGGTLGGVLQFRSETLDRAVNSLGKVAGSLAMTFNEQHKAGMDMLGNNFGDANFAGDFFTISDPKVIPSRLNGPVVVTASFTAPKLSSNLASGNFFSELTNSDYKLEYSGSSFSLTRSSDQKVWSGATLNAINAQITDQGFQLADNAAGYVAGDSFLIEPTRELAKNIGINSQISGDVRSIAAGQPVRSTISLTNAGSMQVSIDRVRIDATLPVPSSSVPLTIGISAGGTSLTLGAGGPFQVSVYSSSGSLLAGSPFSLANPASATPPPIGAGYSYELADGNRRITFSIKGLPTPGDTFKIDMNDGSTGGAIGVSDSGNALLLGRLQTQQTSNGGSATYQGIYAQLVSDIANKAHEVEVTKGAQASLVAQATAARSSDSGVNLDEEAANLLKYQQMYQAAARSISVGQKVFDELLAIARG